MLMRKSQSQNALIRGNLLTLSLDSRVNSRRKRKLTQAKISAQVEHFFKLFTETDLLAISKLRKGLGPNVELLM
jgi:hypothetical protein